MAGLTTIGIATTQPAAADTAFTALNETFNEGTFPPADWQAPYGTWSQDCTTASVIAPMTGCAAVATVTDGAVGLNEFLWNPAAGIPANLENPTLSFYSDFSPDATSNGDSVAVMQASVPGDTGDFSSLVTIAQSTVPPTDATATPVLHTVALTSTNVPIAFRWTSYGDTSPSSTETWAISNVTITGTLPPTPYALTANPISNVVYPHVVAGQPVTIHLSGSSSPTGDYLNFTVTSQPNLGTVGAITQIDATDATVVYTPHALACPDPTGVPGLICPDSFRYTASDVEGNVSTAANVALDIQPGGAAGQTPSISAPTSTPYVTLSQNGSLVQGADLSGSVTVGPTAFPDPVELDVEASSGTIDLLNGVASGASFLNGTASGEQQIDLQGSMAQIDAALSLFMYYPPAGTTPTATINLYAWDLGATGGGPRTSPTQATVTVNGIVNDPPPSLARPTGPLAIATNAGPLHFPSGAATGFFLTDTAASASTQDEVLLSVSGGTLALPASDTSGSTALVSTQSSGGGGTLDLTGTVADLNLALADLTFDPTGLESSTITLSASATDPDTMEASQSGSVPIVVTEAPFAFGATAFTTLENDPAVVFLCADGPAGDPLTFQFTSSPSHGSLVLDTAVSSAGSGCTPTAGAAAYLYTPTAGYIGLDSFGYTVTDTTTGLISSVNPMAITVGAHVKPTAYDVSASTVEDAPVNLTLCGTNPEGGLDPALTFAITSGPNWGTLVAQGAPSVNPCTNGNVAMTYTYTPNPGTFSHDGTDTFEYTVSNGSTSDAASGTITVSTLTPQVFDQTASVDEDGDIILHLCATEPRGTLTFTTFGALHGTLDQLAGTSTTATGPACPGDSLPFGYVHYTPTALYSGPDEIAYSATDGTYTSSDAVINVTVNRVEIKPTVVDQTVTDIAPHSVAVTLTGTSLQGSPLTYHVVTPPRHGTLSGTAPDLVYTPSIASGTDSFTYVANDGTADSAPATVTINVVTPSLSSSICLPGAVITYDHEACAGTLSSVSNGRRVHPTRPHQRRSGCRALAPGHDHQPDGRPRHRHVDRARRHRTVDHVLRRGWPRCDLRHHHHWHRRHARASPEQHRSRSTYRSSSSHPRTSRPLPPTPWRSPPRRATTPPSRPRCRSRWSTAPRRPRSR